ARIQLQAIELQGPRNAMPSLHMAWVLLAWWCSEGASPVCRAIAGTFVLFTFCATLGTGEHYFVDLIVAFPLTLSIFALFFSLGSWRGAQKWTALLSGLFMVAVWFALLRF